MDSKQKLEAGIRNHYSKIVGENESSQLLDELYMAITSTIHEQYNRFSKQYPKSIKRYSTLKVEYLDHPQIFKLIIKIFKQKFENNYLEYSGKVLGISREEVEQFEHRRDEFYNMF